MKRTEKSYNSGTRIVEASLRRSNKSELFRFIIHEKFIARPRPNDVVAIFTAASYIFFINHLFIIFAVDRSVTLHLMQFVVTLYLLRASP